MSLFYLLLVLVFLLIKLTEIYSVCILFNMQSKKKIEKHYSSRVNSRDKGFKILDWESEDAHLGRFNALTDQLDLTGMTLLDVGCGLGDLYGFLRGKNIDVSYTGIDILDTMVKEAAVRYPEGDFISGDMFSRDMFENGAYDIVYSSGIFNLNLGNNRDFLRAALPVFFTVAEKWVVFNLLDPDHPVQSEKYAYFNPEEVLPWVSEYSSHICVVRDYVPHDFTIISKVEN